MRGETRRSPYRGLTPSDRGFSPWLIPRLNQHSPPAISTECRAPQWGARPKSKFLELWRFGQLVRTAVAVTLLHGCYLLLRRSPSRESPRRSAHIRSTAQLNPRSGVRLGNIAGAANDAPHAGTLELARLGAVGEPSARCTVGCQPLVHQVSERRVIGSTQAQHGGECDASHSRTREVRLPGCAPVASRRRRVPAGQQGSPPARGQYAPTKDSVVTCGGVRTSYFRPPRRRCCTEPPVARFTLPVEWGMVNDSS